MSNQRSTTERENPSYNNNNNIDNDFMEDIELQQLSSFHGTTDTTQQNTSSSNSSLSSIFERLSQISEQQQKQLQYHNYPPHINSDQDFLVEDEFYPGDQDDPNDRNDNGGGDGFRSPDSITLRLDEIRKNTLTKRKCLLIAAVVFITWLVTLISFSKGNKFYYNTHGSNSINEHKSQNNQTTIHESTPSPSLVPGKSSDGKEGTTNRKKISLLDYRMGNFFVFNTDFKFVGEDNYIVRNPRNYQFKTIGQEGGPVLFESLKFQYGDSSYSVRDIRMSPLKDKVILITDTEQQWRHSSWSKYWIYDTNTQNIVPLYKENLKLQHAQWSPQGKYITFIYEHNIYIRDTTTDEVIQLTYDGSHEIFNGKPDWVYEEEVLSSDNSIWWSPDDSNLMFMRLDDTKVPIYPLEFFVQELDQKYPTIEEIHYPKPGFDNPIPSLISYNLTSGELRNVPKSEFGDEFVLYYLKYINTEEILIKETDRESNVMNVNIFNTRTGELRKVRQVDATKEYGGWIEKPSEILPITKGEFHGYIDTVVYENFNHLLYFQNYTDSTPYKMLTRGEFDITEQYSYNLDTDEVFLISTIPEDPLSHHFFKIKLNDDDEKEYHMQNLTDTSKKAYYDLTFNKDSSYAVLDYQGPEIPYQKMISLKEFNTTYYNLLKPLNNNLMATISLSKFDIPTTTYGNLSFDGLNFQYMEIKPLNFDPLKKYPLLVSIYGGPGSVKLSNSYNVGFEHVVSSSLDLIVLYLDPRGTGGKGWNFKKFAKNKIGYWEPRDITNIVKVLMLHKLYINRDKTAIWGWSYGGFTTLKTLEYDAGSVFKYGMAVAPVTDWTFYDSIYTERYMDKPENNVNGYSESRINNIKNFQKVKKFLIMHGTGDDNVHLQNTLKLLDEFDMNGVENYDMHVFPDSNHSIYYDNANTIVYDKLFNWLKNVFER